MRCVERTGQASQLMWWRRWGTGRQRWCAAGRASAARQRVFRGLAPKLQLLIAAAEGCPHSHVLVIPCKLHVLSVETQISLGHACKNVRGWSCSRTARLSWAISLRCQAVASAATPGLGASAALYYVRASERPGLTTAWSWGDERYQHQDLFCSIQDRSLCATMSPLLHRSAHLGITLFRPLVVFMCCFNSSMFATAFGTRLIQACAWQTW